MANVTYYRQPGANLALKDGGQQPDSYRAYLQGTGGQPSIIYGVDQNTLKGLGVDVNSLEDVSTASKRLGLSTANGDFYGIAGGQNFNNDAAGLKNIFSSYDQNTTTKATQDKAIADRNAVLGGNTYQGGSITPQQQQQATQQGNNQVQQDSGQTVNFDPNTGKQLSPGQSVTYQGQTYTQGQPLPNSSNQQNSNTSTQGQTGSPQLDTLLEGMGKVLDRLTANGTSVNPNTEITPEMAAQFMTMAQNNLSAFIPYATKEIEPYYTSQLAQAKQSFLTSVGYSVQRQQQLEQDLQKTYNDQLKGIGDSLAEQGFAQSGMRGKQETDLAYQTNRQIQDQRQSLQNTTTQAAQQFASTYGGANVPQFNIATAPEASGGSKLALGQGSQPLYNLSDSVYQGLIGSQQYQKTTDINTRAGALASAFQQNQGVNQQRSLLI